jgi:hypothetical protein
MKKMTDEKEANTGNGLTINMNMEDGQIVSGTYNGLSLSLTFCEK